MKAPITDKTLGIDKPYGNDVKFRDVRKKAKDEEDMRYKKVRKNKAIKFPKFKIGDEVVLTSGWQSQQFHLAEVIDIDDRNERSRSDGFNYFAILRKTTDPNLICRIGRLLSFSEGSWWRTDFCPANVENKHIHWSTASVD